jgi:predicted phage terminase large subunit-like protein
VTEIPNRPPTLEELAHSKLLSYVAYQFPQYVIGNMHLLIAAYLEAVERGDITRLMIWAPPRHGKPLYEEEQVLMSDGSYKKLKDIKVGDYVITHKRRPKKVLKIYDQGELPTIQLNTNFGRNPCTAKDHPFLTPDGWVEAGELKINDSLAIVEIAIPEHKNQFPSYYLPDTITSIEDTGMRKCRCLLVEDDHSFTVQNIVVHNTALVGEYFPAWYLGRNPEHHIIYTTYNQERGNDVGRRVRDQAISENFQRIFPSCNVLKDSKAISHFSTMQKGEYFNVGMGGAIVGRGANCLPAETMLSVEINKIRKELNVEIVYSLFNQGVNIKVLSFDHKEGIPIYKNIIAMQIQYANELVQVTTKSDIELRLTKNHPVFTLMNSYVASEFLQIGDRTIISNPNINYDTISSIKRISTNSIPVYDIQVEGTSNFFANKILTHNCLIIDDPIKDRQEAESKTARKNVQNWYQAVAYTRVMPGGKIVVINTRWHSSDLSGYLMEEHAHENWAILDLKAIAEPGDILKRKEGEALWPEFRDLEQLEIIKTALGPREWNAQFQQRPTALGGGRVKFEWINHYEQLPKPDEIQRIVASWDTAYKPEQINDPTACTIWIITATGYYLIDVRNKRLEFPDLVKEVQLVHEIHHPSAHLIEGRATGQSLIQELKRSTRIPTVEISTKNINNEIRFDAITTLFESGKVWFPKQAHWLSETEDQICSFPTAPHDDIADSTSQFLNWVNKPRYVPRPPSKLYWK